MSDRSSSLSRRLVPLLIFVGLVAVLVIAAAAARDAHRLEAPAMPDRAAMASMLALARAGIEKGAGLRASAPDAAVIGSVTGTATGPVFVSVYGIGTDTRGQPPFGIGAASAGKPVGLGQALLEAAVAAGAKAKERPGFAEKLASGRIKIDLAGPAEDLWTELDAYVDVAIDPGRDGLVATHDKGQEWFLPSWTVERALDPDRALKLLRQRVKYKDVDVRVGRFRTAAFVEGTQDEPGPLAIFRGNVLVGEVTSAAVKRSLELGGAYLARMIDENGRYCYTYDAVADRCDKDYNLLRHNGTTYSLYQIYQEASDPVTLAAAERATEWMRRQVRAVSGDPTRAFMLEGKLAKLGAAGLGLLALVEREKTVRDGRDRETMRQMARLIKSMQHPDGYLDSYFKWDPSAPDREDNSIYYPGEALLGLVRLYSIDPQPWILDTARLSARYLALDRWRWAGIEMQVPIDAWLTQALAELYPLTKDPALKAYCYELVREMRRTQLRGDEGAPVDMAGGPLGGINLPAVTPAGSRNEAMTAAYRMAQRAGDREEAAWIREASMQGAQFQLSQQYRPATSYFLPNPARAMGGFRSRPDKADVRIDYVQHNATGLQTLLHILQEEGR